MTCQCDDDHTSLVEADEKIEATRIYLRRAAHTTAVVTEFRAADRVLAGWLDAAKYGARFDFEVRFCDGFVFCGSYQRLRRRRCNPSFSNYVRTALEAMTAAQPSWLPNVARYSVES